MGGASSTAEERKTGSASSSADAQSHSAAGRIPLRELWEYVNRGDTNAKHYFVGAEKVILQSLTDKYTKAGNSVLGYGVIDREQNSLSSELARGDIKFMWLLGKSPWIENLCLNLRQHFPGIKVIAINS